MTDITQAAGDGPWPQRRIRFARPADLPELMALCRNLSQENAIAPMMDDIVCAELERCIAKDGGFIGVIGNVGEPIEGAICLRFSSLWYNSSYWWLEDKFVHVLQKYRASSNGNDLIEWAIWWRDQLQIPLMLGIVSNERTEAKIALYRRKLGPMSGALFLVGAKTGLTQEH